MHNRDECARYDISHYFFFVFIAIELRNVGTYLFSYVSGSRIEYTFIAVCAHVQPSNRIDVLFMSAYMCVRCVITSQGIYVCIVLNRRTAECSSHDISFTVTHTHTHTHPPNASEPVSNVSRASIQHTHIRKKTCTHASPEIHRTRMENATLLGRMWNKYTDLST